MGRFISATALCISMLLLTACGGGGGSPTVDGGSGGGDGGSGSGDGGTGDGGDSGDGGSDGGSGDGSDSDGPLKSEGIPNTFKALACIDEDVDFVCDNPLKALDEVYEGIDLAQLEADARVLIELSPNNDVGVGNFTTFDGKRYMSLPAGEKDASPLSLLAFGLMELSKELGPRARECCITEDGWILQIPTKVHLVKDFLKDNFLLDGSGKQNDAILQSFNFNLEKFGNHGLDLKQAYDADIKAMAESLVNLTKAVPADGSNEDPIDLSGLAPCEADFDGGQCKQEEDFPRLAEESDKPSFAGLFRVSGKVALDTAYEIRKKDEKPAPHEKAFDALECKEDQQKQIYMYGFPDNFSPVNNEPTNPQPLFGAGSPSTPYDFNASTYGVFAVFAETLTGLPTDITSSQMVMGVRSGQGFTPFNYYFIGDLNNLTSSSYHQLSDLATQWTNISGSQIYHEDMSNIMVNANQSLLDQVQAGQPIDIMMYTNVDVDFIAIAACGPKPKLTGIPIKEVISTLTSKFECKTEDGEQYIEITGGVADDFTQPTDVHTPASSLPNSVLKYDVPIVEKSGIFGDTLALPGGLTISRAQLMINLRPSSPAATNDRVMMGDFANVNGPGFTTVNPDPAIQLWPSPTLNGGTAYIVDGSYDASGTSSSLLTILNSNNSNGAGLDILVGDNTEVDTTLLQLCAGCKDTDGDGYCDDEEKIAGSDPGNPNSTPPDLDGDGVLNGDDCAPNDPDLSTDCGTVIDYPNPLPDTCKAEISIDLSQASSWLDSVGNPPTVNNAYPNYWDSSMNWFDYGVSYDEDHKVSRSFCSCGGGYVKVDEMKTDSTAYIDLIDQTTTGTSPIRVVERTQSGLSTMVASAVNESGLTTFAGTGNGVNFDLDFVVHNDHRFAGGAVEGELRFIGHEGACTIQDVPPLGPIGPGPIDVGDPIDRDPVEPDPVGPFGPYVNAGTLEAIHGHLTNIIFVLDPVPKYIKLDADGEPLADQSQSWSDTGNETDFTQWSCVKDVETNLIWEVKRGGNGVFGDEGIHDTDDIFTWYNPDPAINEGNAGVTSFYNNTCSGDHCDTDSFVTQVNNSNFCGSSTNWRLPFKDELESLVDLNVGMPTINSAFFPNVIVDTNPYSPASLYLTNTPSVYGTGPYFIWDVHFTDGISYPHANKADKRPARLVRN